GDAQLRLRASVGSARISSEFDNAGSALAAAEQALRTARTEPAGVALYAAPEVREPAPDGLAEQLASAVAQRRLELAYQPIVAVAGGDDAQYQTLLRLRDADGGLRPAGELLPIAEAAGLMDAIDRQVLELAIAML